MGSAQRGFGGKSQVGAGRIMQVFSNREEGAEQKATMNASFMKCIGR